MMDPEVASAIAATLSGDTEAYAGVVRSFDDELRAFLARRCANAAAVDDLCQDTFVIAFQRLAQFSADKGSFPGWLKGIARNLLMQQVEARARDAERLGRLERFEIARVRDLLAHDDSRLAGLQGCLAKLPPAYRDLLDRRYRDELPVRELADALQRTATWV
ncbi:MAG: sigma-70 family RNA polymerase sigma factor, partial [Planctomycetes bacterium]|nr:sigma-70 family RNA polymerase sigma factor [Planctomycetota bacterium]